MPVRFQSRTISQDKPEISPSSPKGRSHPSYQPPPSRFFLVLVIVILAAVTLGWLAVGTHKGQATLFRLKGESSGRTNILLLGRGGDTHEGGNLADSILMVSLDHQGKKIGFLSIPRDLQAKTKYGVIKINAVHAYGENKDKNGALAMRDIVEEITGQPIHYLADIDFIGFQKLIDELGGVEVVVEKDFYDPLYPNIALADEGPLSFKAGKQTLNGVWALNYARSRFGNNEEGGDFRRAKRHQDILLGIKNRLRSSQTWLDPTRLLHLTSIIKEHFTTDMGSKEIARLLKIYPEYDSQNIINKVIDNTDAGPLTSGRDEAGSYVLKPKSGDFDYSEIQKIAADLFVVANNQNSQ